MNPLGIPEQDTFDGAGIPVQDLPENQDPDVAHVVDQLTGAKTPIGEQPDSPPRVQSSSAEPDLMGSAPGSEDRADEPPKMFEPGGGSVPVEPSSDTPAQSQSFSEVKPKRGPGSRGPYKKKGDAHAS